MPHNGNGMEFLTLHQLSRELNKPERVLRHRFKNLLKKNTLVEGEDFIREGYIDDQHFVFKINPVRFAQLTIPNAKPPAMLEESRCFTYAEDLPEYFDRS